jgi:hypothetical protein
MERMLGSSEHIFWLLGKSVGSPVVMMAEVSGCAEERAWRNAFDALQCRHPLLQARIAKTRTHRPFFERCGDAKIPVGFHGHPQWTGDKSYEARLDELLGVELSRPFNDTCGPLIRANVIVIGARTLTIIAAHHAICDGMSLTYCFRDLLLAVSGTSLQSLPFPASLDSRCGLLATQTATLPDPGESAAYPELMPTVRRLKLSRDASARFCIRARVAGTTVHGGLTSAVLRAFYRLGIRTDQPQIRVFSPVDVRAQCGVNDECGLFLGTMYASFNRCESGGFWELAREAMDRFGVTAAREAIPVAIGRRRDLIEAGIDTKGAVALRQGSMARDIMVTNVGRTRFDAEIGSFKVKSLWGPLALSGCPGDYTVGVSTIDDCIHLSLASRLPTDAILPAVEDEMIAACEI